MNKTTSIIIAIIVIIGGYWLLTSKEMQPTNVAIQEAQQVVETPLPSTDPSMQTKSFTIEGGNFTFTPNMISVNKGDTVQITFKNMEGLHDLVIDEFNIKTKQISAGQEEIVEFVADTIGAFEFYCSVGSHRAMGMVGTLEVK